MDPITMAIIQGIYGVGQKMSAAGKRRQAEAEFDKYDIPTSVLNMMSEAQALASQRGLPGEDIYRQRISRGTAQGVESAERSAQSSSDILGTLASVYANQQKMEENLAIEGAKQYQRNKQIYMSSLEKMGQYETERWKYNEMYPYMQAMNTSGAMDASGNVNLGSAIKTGVSYFGAQQENKYQNERFDKWMESKGFGDDPSSPAKYDPSSPAKYDPSYPAKYDPSYPAKYDPSYPAKYDPSYPAKDYNDPSYPAY